MADREALTRRIFAAVSLAVSEALAEARGTRRGGKRKLSLPFPWRSLA